VTRRDDLAALEALGSAERIVDTLTRGIADFAAGRLEIEGVVIRRFKPRADGSCLLQYDVEVRRAEDGRAERQVWVGSGRPGAELQQLQRQALDGPLHEPAVGSPFHRLRDPDLLLWVFPNDPVLTGLATLWDEERLGAFVDAHREAFHLPLGAQVATVETVETVRVKYVGTERCTLRHEIALSDGSKRVVFSKLTDDPAALRRSFEAMRGFHAALRTSTVSVPDPFLFDPQMDALFAPGLEGTNADECIDELDLEAAGADIGRALATLHQCEIDGLPELRDDELVRRLPRARTVLGELGGAHRTRVDELSARLEAAQPRLTRISGRPVHGAFRLSQLLVTTDGFGLLDFDSCARANPIFDLGSFVAYLVYLGLKGKLEPERADACIRSFCLAYEQSAPWGLPRDLLRWHVAAQLVTKHARRSSVRRSKKGDLDKKRRKALELVTRLLDSASGILSETRALA